jgi:hypothetical protein
VFRLLSWKLLGDSLDIMQSDVMFSFADGNGKRKLSATGRDSLRNGKQIRKTFEHWEPLLTFKAEPLAEGRCPLN